MRQLRKKYQRLRKRTRNFGDDDYLADWMFGTPPADKDT
jgi:hypothetical protein